MKAIWVAAFTAVIFSGCSQPADINDGPPSPCGPSGYGGSADSVMRTYPIELSPKETVQLTYSVINCHDYTQPADFVTIWKSDTPSIATVDSEGLVTALTPGNATIIGSEDKYDTSATVPVTVIAKTPVTQAP